MSALAAAGVLTVPLASWYLAVNRTVPEPYLDEIFHIPQAQHYCHGHFEIWDPKITTPPGVYLLSVLFKPILGCDASALRLINVLSLIALLFAVNWTYVERRRLHNGSRPLPAGFSGHSALNTVLFPPLFFFSAMYYTDIASTLSFVAYYCVFLRNQSEKNAGVVSKTLQIVLALASLWFRQTNIFWVAVAPLLIEAVHKLDQSHQVVKDSMYRGTEGFGDSIFSILQASWRFEAVYDPPVSNAYLDGFVLTCLSIVVCGIKATTQPKRAVALVLSLLPHLVVLVTFVGFILVNGSVVLGDKSNHVATINLPQMLYIWPYFAFFSWPLLLPQLLLVPTAVLWGSSGSKAYQSLFNWKLLLRRAVIAGAGTIIAATVVHFNTVVHPFMLADNRHYTFYIFKRLLRPQWMRYAVTPIYIVSAWLCVGALSATPSASEKSVEYKNTSSQAKAKAKSKAQKPTVQDPARQPIHIPDGTDSATTSFIIVFVATTALQLCTAPLFEPRYLILPWLFWRIHLPAQAGNFLPKGNGSGKSSSAGSLDLRLLFETVWFLVINAATGYIFLKWTFSWASEPDAAQRFMW